jgi:hypothetical protein
MEWDSSTRRCTSLVGSGCVCLGVCLGHRRFLRREGTGHHGRRPLLPYRLEREGHAVCLRTYLLSFRRVEVRVWDLKSGRYLMYAESRSRPPTAAHHRSLRHQNQCGVVDHLAQASSTYVLLFSSTTLYLCQYLRYPPSTATMSPSAQEFVLNSLPSLSTPMLTLQSAPRAGLSLRHGRSAH